jgi:ElaB/YqjD/DUF883 family membrane-anchored ribosome-binding protein
MRHSALESKLEDRAQELYSASRQIARRGSSKARSFIHERPFLSLLIGAGAGALLTLLFRPRR